MIPQSRIPTTPYHPPWPRSSRMLSPFSYSFSPEKIPETSQSLEIRAVSPALSYPPFILSSLRNFYSFPVPPGFFQKLPLSPLPRPNILFLSSHSKPIRRSRPCARTGAEPLAVPHGSSFFRSPHPPDRRRTVNGPFLRPGFPSALCLLQPSAGMPPLSSPFCAQNAPASPTAPCSLPKLPIPFSPLGNRFILLQNRSFFFFLRQNYEKLSGFN